MSNEQKERIRFRQSDIASGITTRPASVVIPSMQVPAKVLTEQTLRRFQPAGFAARGQPILPGQKIRRIGVSLDGQTVLSP
jgi:hypothetical protein